MKNPKFFLGLLLVLIISLGTILFVATYSDENKFLPGLIVGVILVLAFLASFTLYTIQEMKSESIEKENRFNKLDEILELLKKYENSDVIEEYGNKGQLKKVTRKNEVLVAQIKNIANIISEM